MSTTFSKDEMIQANQFRSLSQKALQQQIQTHEKIGVLFHNYGLDAVLLSYKRYEALINRLHELENALEDFEIEQTFGDRLKTAEEDWLRHPEDMSTLALYRLRQKERTQE